MRRIQHGRLRRIEHGALLGHFLLADPPLGLSDDPLFDLFLRGRRRHAHGGDHRRPEPRQEVADPLGPRVHHGGRRLCDRRLHGRLLYRERGIDPGRPAHGGRPQHGRGAGIRPRGRRLLDHPADERHQRPAAPLRAGPAPADAFEPLRHGLCQHGRRRRDHDAPDEGQPLDLFCGIDGLARVVSVLGLWGHRDGLDAPRPLAGLQEPPQAHGRRRVCRGTEDPAGPGQRTGRGRGAHQDPARAEPQHGQDHGGHREPLQHREAQGGTDRAAGFVGVQAGRLFAGTGRRGLQGLHVGLRELQPVAAVHLVVSGDLLDRHLDRLADPHRRLRLSGGALDALSERILQVVRPVVLPLWRSERRPLHHLSVVCRRHRMLQVWVARCLHPAPPDGAGQDVHVVLLVQHRAGVAVRPPGRPVLGAGLCRLRQGRDDQPDLQRPDRQPGLFRLLVRPQDLCLRLFVLFAIDDALPDFPAEGLWTERERAPRPAAIEEELTKQSKAKRLQTRTKDG
mmetsp:Transcript_89285/g.182095  ORF Transcript_89285/g.182095 Transcript_89285/m.182095 type:complete len:509 (-) Transcript_89285:201-1727(-)